MEQELKQQEKEVVETKGNECHGGHHGCLGMHHRCKKVMKALSFIMLVLITISVMKIAFSYDNQSMRGGYQGDMPYMMYR